MDLKSKRAEWTVEICCTVLCIIIIIIIIVITVTLKFYPPQITQKNDVISDESRSAAVISRPP